MTLNQLRWGILSTARINRRVIPPIRLAARSSLIGVASRSLDKAAAYAKEWQIPQVYGRYEDLLADPGIDAVYISLPNALHADWVVAAAEAGKHILCEKPLVQTLDDFDRVATAAQANGVHLNEAFAHLHLPHHRQIRSWVEDGRIGQLRHIEGHFHFYLPPERSDNIRFNADLGGGSMWDLGVYPNALAVYYAGGDAPQRVWAARRLGDSDVDLFFAGMMQFDSGVTAQINCGFRNPFREALRLVGDAGLITLPRPHNTTDGSPTVVSITNNQGETERVEIPFKDSYLAEIEAFEATVLDGAAPVLPLSLSRNFLRSVLALQESARSGELVTP